MSITDIHYAQGIAFLFETILCCSPGWSQTLHPLTQAFLGARMSIAHTKLPAVRPQVLYAHSLYHTLFANENEAKRKKSMFKLQAQHP